MEIAIIYGVGVLAWAYLAPRLTGDADLATLAIIWPVTLLFWLPFALLMAIGRAGERHSR